MKSAAHDPLLNASATAELGLSKSQEVIRDAIFGVKKPAKNHARNAINHLVKAWAIRDIDREMAVLRAITAEEEAATAIFKSLKRIGYSGMDAINPYRHDHKAALFFLLAAVFRQKAVLDDLGVTLNLRVQTKVTPCLVELEIGLPHLKPLVMKPVPALHFNWNELDGVPLDLVRELAELYSERGTASYRDELEKRANKRNELLYAHDEGVAFVNHPVDQVILVKKDLVFDNLGILLMIDQTMERQLFVQQCVDALVKIVGTRKPKKAKGT